MRESIERELSRIEQEREVRVLYACESGSRAWGFASPDSDYDVRFIYAHSIEWYLSIQDHRDVIEEMAPGNLDLAGWEIRKSLRLFAKSNPPLLEWLRSPLVYRSVDPFTREIRDLAESHFSPNRCFRHYLHMAEGNFRGYLQGEEVWTKKYLYVLRPVLACRWLERNLGAVPMEFDTLRERTVEEPAVQTAIAHLLERKRTNAELGAGPRDPIIGKFLETELARLRSVNTLPDRDPDLATLNAFFRKTVCTPVDLARIHP